MKNRIALMASLLAIGSTAALAMEAKRRYPPGLRTSVATVRGPTPALMSS